MDPAVIYDIYSKLEGVFIATHLDRAYLEGDSILWYRGMKEYFEWKHGSRQAEILSIFKKLGAETFNLLDEPYYFVSILRR